MSVARRLGVNEGSSVVRRSASVTQGGKVTDAGIPVLDWDFTSTQDIGAFLPDITFTRPSTATYRDASGVLQEASSGEARFDHDANGNALGLLMEGQRTNKCTNYNIAPIDLTGVTKSGDAAATLTVVDDSAELAAAGLGSICNGNVYKLDNSGGSSDAFAKVTGQVGNTNAHSMSAYCRAGSASPVLHTNFGAGAVSFSNTSYELVKSQGFTPSGTTDELQIQCAAGEVAYFIANQLEEASFASSLIPVAGSSATRNADVATITDLSWFNAVQGTLVIEWSVYDTTTGTGGNAKPVLGIDDGSADNAFRIFSADGDVAGPLRAQVRSGGTKYADLQGGSISADQTKRAAFAYAADDFAFYADGSEIGSDNSGLVPAGLTTLRLGVVDFGGSLFGHIQRLIVYPARLSNLPALTA